MFGGLGQPPPTAASSTGFSFGGNAAAPAGTGFSFGAPSTGQPLAGPTGFGLSSGTAAPASTTATGSGFNFGAATAPKAAAPSGLAAGTGGFGGFNFGGTPGQTQTSNAAPASTGTGFSFGNTAATTAATPGTAAAASGFNFGKPAATTVQPTAPIIGNTGLGFGGVGANLSSNSSVKGLTLGGTGSSTVTAPLSGFNFGGSSTTTPATTAAPSVPSLGLGGSTFGAKPAATTTASGLGGFGAPVSTAGSSLLGGLLGSTSTAATTKTSTPSTAAGFGFGSTAASTAPQTSTTVATGFGFGTAASTAPTGLGGSSFTGFGGSTGLTSSAATSSTLSATTATTTSSTSSGRQMSFRQLEELTNKWTTELEEQEKNFLDQATQVNAWDRIVMENGDKIIGLNKDVEKVKLDQQKLDHELDFVHSQQRELEDLLSPLEKALDSLPPISYQQHADVEREHTYMLAESLDAQLKRMGQDLKEIIERLNATNSKPDQNDPVQQVTKILNAHFMSLQWVDRNTANLQKRVEDISKQMNMEKREQERNFRLAYS